MADAPLSDSPLDAVAETVDQQTMVAFELLGNETRLAILLALWDAIDPHPETLSEDARSSLSFSELHDRVGLRDSGHFNYHLDKLTGIFVEQTEDGYTLTTPANQILHTILAGTLTDQPSFEGVRLDTVCWHCGSSLVIDYSDGLLTMRCTNCDGLMTSPDDPPGILLRMYRPPVGLVNRTPQEFYRHGNIWSRHRTMSTMEGVCPDCSGTMTATLHVCENHDAKEGTACGECGWMYKTKWTFVCDVCKNNLSIRGTGPIFTEMAVLRFCSNHGLDVFEVYETDSWEELSEATEDVDVTARDPAELRVTLELDGDRLKVTLDDEAQVTDVTEVTD